MPRLVIGFVLLLGMSAPIMGCNSTIDSPPSVATQSSSVSSPDKPTGMPHRNDAQRIRSLIQKLEAGETGSVNDLISAGQPAVGPVTTAMISSDAKMRANCARILDKLDAAPTEGSIEYAYYVWGTTGSPTQWQSQMVRIGDAAVPRLIAELDGDLPGALAAFDALGILANSKDAYSLTPARITEAVNAIEKIVQFEYDPKAESVGSNNLVQATTISTLGKFGTDRCVEILLTTATEGHPAIRMGAKYALAECITEHSPFEAHMLLVREPLSFISAMNSAEILAEKHSYRAYPELSEIVLLPRSVSKSSSIAAIVLERFWPERMNEITNVFIKNLDSPDQDIREHAIYTLGLIRSAGAVAPLLDILNNQSSDHRALAAKSLGKIGDESAKESLIAAIGDRDEAVRLASISALGGLNDKSTVDLLLQLLRDKETQESASSSLRAIDGVIIDLIREMRGEAPHTRRNPHAAVSLVLIGGREVNDALDAEAKRTDANGEGVRQIIDLYSSNGQAAINAASAMLNSRDFVLRDIAQTWAKENGYHIYTSFFPRTK